MTTYKLDETPDAYISAVFDQGSYVYKMLSIKGESSYSIIRDIDLRKDKLIVYGTEIKESMWAKLHNSLLLRAKAGKVYVNCNGECYIVVYQTNSNNIVTNKFYRPIDNVIFDWSQFGVTVPNSVNDSLRKQLHQKDQEVTMMSTLLSTMSTLLCSAKGEASAGRKQQQDTEMELQKVRNQLCVKEFELNATKTKLELSKEEVKELQDQVSTSNKKDYKNLEMELQKVQHQLSCTMSELETTKIVWEFSKEQLISSKKEYEEMTVKVQSMQDQVYKAVADLQSERVEFEKENEDVITELQKVQNELSSSNLELQLTKSRLETSHKKIFELEEQLSSDGKKYKRNWGGKVQEQLWLIMKELQSIKVLVDFTAEKEVDLEDQCVTKVIEIVDDQ